jgi:hypothetical protein
MKKNYPARIHLNCPTCNKSFNVPPSRVKNAKTVFCGKDCANVAQRTAKRYEFTCETCNKKFIDTKDHGADRRFCSRKCFCANAPDLSEKECSQCGDLFKPIRSAHTEDGVSKHCSRECYVESQKTGEQRNCLHCGVSFYTNPSHDNVCCSLECKSKYFSGSTAHAWRGGKFVSESTGHKFVALERPDRVGKYIAEHRMVAIKKIGRLLERHEMVIHLNNIPDDNRPENLYICGTNSQMKRIHAGSLPWPKKSNLTEYK